MGEPRRGHWQSLSPREGVSLTGNKGLWGHLAMMASRYGRHPARAGHCRGVSEGARGCPKWELSIATGMGVQHELVTWSRPPTLPVTQQARKHQAACSQLRVGATGVLKLLG